MAIKWQTKERKRLRRSFFRKTYIKIKYPMKTIMQLDWTGVMHKCPIVVHLFQLIILSEKSKMSILHLSQCGLLHILFFPLLKHITNQWSYPLIGLCRYSASFYECWWVPFSAWRNSVKKKVTKKKNFAFQTRPWRIIIIPNPFSAKR